MKNLFLKTTLTLTLAFAATAVAAQEAGNRDAQGKVVRGPYETNGLFDNVFIGVAGGVNRYHGENDSYGSFGKRLAPALDIYAGKWLTPSVGLRLGWSGLSARGWTSGRTQYAKELVEGNIYREKFGVSYLHGDVMWNFSNAVSGYKESRRWNFIPFVGAGWARSWGNGVSDNELAVSIGLLNTIRLCDLMDLTLEARRMYVNQRFDGVVRGAKVEGMSSVTVGLSFKLNRRGFRRVAAAAAPDYTPYLTRIEQLEGDNRALTNDNAALKAENEALKNRKPEPSKCEAQPLPGAHFFFEIGKAELDAKELLHLESYAKQLAASGAKKRVVLTGMADDATGSPQFNQELSERRAEYVYRLLVDQYGIAPSRLEKRAVGDKENIFAEPRLNRVVLVE